MSYYNTQLDMITECLFDDKKIITEIKSKANNKETDPRSWRLLPRTYHQALIKKALNKSQQIKARFTEILEQM